MKKRKTLAVLHQITVRSPCHESWESMSGSSRSRHCERCNHSVTNLSALSAKQASRLIGENASSRLCVRYQLDGEGKIIFRPRFDWLDRAWRYATLCIATILTLLGLSQSASAECAEDKKTGTECNAHQATMGKISAPATPTPSEASPTPATPIVMGEIALAPTSDQRFGETEKK